MNKPLPPELANDWLRIATASMAGRRASPVLGAGPPGEISERAALDADALIERFLQRFPTERPRGAP